MSPWFPDTSLSSLSLRGSTFWAHGCDSTSTFDTTAAVVAAAAATGVGAAAGALMGLLAIIRKDISNINKLKSIAHLWGVFFFFQRTTEISIYSYQHNTNDYTYKWQLFWKEQIS